MIQGLQYFLWGDQGPGQVDLAVHVSEVPANPGPLRVDLLSTDSLAPRIVPRMEAERSGSGDNENHAPSL